MTESTKEQGVASAKQTMPLVSRASNMTHLSGEIHQSDHFSYHITWVTHNSRISERMKLYKVKIGEPVYFNDDIKKEISGYLDMIAKEYNINIMNKKVNCDHVHVLLCCAEPECDDIVRTLKSKSTYYYKKKHNIDQEFHLWAQKYNSSIIKSEDELNNVNNYIENNELKHEE
jgi:REP element-mobilizing transposase RayT